jgi:hypothetical protein
MKLAPYHTPGAYNFQMASRFLENLWAPDVKYLG